MSVSDEPRTLAELIVWELSIRQMIADVPLSDAQEAEQEVVDAVQRAIDEFKNRADALKAKEKP